jgi:ribosomal protein S18 acetylase RimI-like enzyme
MTGQSKMFKDRDGEAIFITQLTENMAMSHMASLISIHNQIPFQYWDKDKLLSVSDDVRKYTRKWELSFMAFEKSRTRPIALCVAFEIVSNDTVPGKCVYIHRLAVAPDFRRRYVGTILNSQVMANAFAHGTVRIYCQTNDTTENVGAQQFYLGAGFEIVGRKSYSNREDLVLASTRERFEHSRHWQQWSTSHIWE